MTVPFIWSPSTKIFTPINGSFVFLSVIVPFNVNSLFDFLIITCGTSFILSLNFVVSLSLGSFCANENFVKNRIKNNAIICCVFLMRIFLSYTD